MHRKSTSSDYFNGSLNPSIYTERHSLPPPPPPNTTAKPTHTNTFVHKLYNMVIDTHYQHLISWAYSGSSFIVCNIMEFSRDVLPKHFKHNNFSSFVRQLNMYGFHKVNKSPRGHRTLAENQIWEFSHPKFLRNRPDLLDDIKRKALESETGKRETGDIQSHLQVMQASQTDLMQQIQNLYENFSQVMKEMQELKQKQDQQTQIIKTMTHYISQQNGGKSHVLVNMTYLILKLLGQLPAELNLDQVERKQPPSIFITSHDPSSNQPSHDSLLNDMLHRSPLTVQTQNLPFSTRSLSPFRSPLPPSPSPSMLISDDELDAASSLYSPNSPHTPRQSSSSQNPYPSFMNSLDPLSHQ
ncbi:Putative Winged helix DNA-binding domain-containing protein (Fragment) [Rhizopus microsporus]